MKNKSIKIFAPASISMHSYGLKDVSIAINKPVNEILAHLLDNSKSVEINTFTKEKNDVEGVKNIVLKYAIDFHKEVNSEFGVDINIYNRIPFFSGLGILEANIAGVIVALNILLKAHLKVNELFNYIVDKSIEWGINISESGIAVNLFGGIILYNDDLYDPIQKLYVPHGMNLSIIISRNNIDKNILKTINVEEFFLQSKNNATFIKSLMTTDHDLLSKSLKNNVFEEKITKNISWFKDVKDISYSNGVYAIGFSKFGETVFILNPNTLIKDNNHKDLMEHFNSKNIKAEIISTEINLNGLFKF